MPDRIVRTGILTSEKVNELSWFGEVFYRRLMSIVDDYGRYDARPTILRAQIFPLKINQVSDADIVKLLEDCSKAGLISIYEVDKKKYLELLNFNQRLRAKNSKFPPPADTRRHPPASAVKCNGDEYGDGGESVKPPADEISENKGFVPVHRKPNIPDKHQVAEVFSRNGGTVEMAKAFYNKYEAVGWFLNGSPITNFANLVGSYVQNWKDNERRRPLNNFEDNQQNATLKVL